MEKAWKVRPTSRNKVLKNGKRLGSGNTGNFSMNKKVGATDDAFGKGTLGSQ